MMRALHREKPDRLPVTVHQWQGYHLDTYLGGISAWRPSSGSGWTRRSSTSRTWGSSGSSTPICPSSTRRLARRGHDVSSDPDNRIDHHTIHTPEGTLTYKTAGDRKTTWITEYLIKHDEDIELIRKYMPVPTLDPAPIAAVRRGRRRGHPARIRLGRPGRLLAARGLPL